MDELRNTFNKLELIMDGEPWIRFKDDIFFALCLPLWDSDRDGGITQEEADIAVELNSSNSPFSYNDNIIDATDFKYLNWTPYGHGQMQLFRECTNLRRVAFRNNTLLGSGVFMNCTSLEYVELPENVSNPDSYYGNVFQGCTSLKTVNLPKNKTRQGKPHGHRGRQQRDADLRRRRRLELFRSRIRDVRLDLQGGRSLQESLGAPCASQSSRPPPILKRMPTGAW